MTKVNRHRTYGTTPELRIIVTHRTGTGTEFGGQLVDKLVFSSAAQN